MRLFLWDQGERMTHFEHGSLERHKRSIKRMRTVFHRTASDVSSSPAPVGRQPLLLSATSTSSHCLIVPEHYWLQRPTWAEWHVVPAWLVFWMFHDYKRTGGAKPFCVFRLSLLCLIRRKRRNLFGQELFRWSCSLYHLFLWLLEMDV